MSETGVSIKFGRARERVAEAIELGNAWIREEPFHAERVEESDGGLTIRVRFKSQPPRALGAILGDAVHNARSALDHLAWELVRSNGGQPTRDTCFPISDQPRPRGKIAAALRGAAPEVIERVFDLMPWRGGDSQLWQLHELDIWDKHRLLLAVGAVSDHVLVGGGQWDPFGKGQPFTMPTLALRPKNKDILTDGSAVFHVAPAARSGPDLLQFKGLTAVVVFGPDGPCPGEPLPRHVADLISHAERIAEDVRPTV